MDSICKVSCGYNLFKGDDKMKNINDKLIILIQSAIYLYYYWLQNPLNIFFVDMHQIFQILYHKYPWSHEKIKELRD